MTPTRQGFKERPNYWALHGVLHGLEQKSMKLFKLLSIFSSAAARLQVPMRFTMNSQFKNIQYAVKLTKVVLLLLCDKSSFKCQG
jgi:hypothetical protein